MLDNDCVIVPDFGGFVAHQVFAHYDERDHTFLPPKRTLGFNPQLRINDSLLAQSYVTAYDISYPEALRRIEEEVGELKSALSEDGYYTLADIGTLSINTDGNYQFEPCEGGILSPEYYGLGGCYFPMLKESAISHETASKAESIHMAPATQEKHPTLLEFTDTGDELEEHTIQVKMSWIRNAVAVAAAIVAFFVMATPIANSDLDTSAMSQLQSQLLYKLMPQDTNVVPATPVADSLKTQMAQHTQKALDTQDTLSTPKGTADNPATPYCIVLASHVKSDNAEIYVEKLKKQGYEKAEIYTHNNVIRVIYGSYETEAEAYRQLNKMNTKEEFYEAWVYKKRV